MPGVLDKGANTKAGLKDDRQFQTSGIFDLEIHGGSDVVFLLLLSACLRPCRVGWRLMSESMYSTAKAIYFPFSTLCCSHLSDQNGQTAKLQVGQNEGKVCNLGHC